MLDSNYESNDAALYKGRLILGHGTSFEGKRF